MFKFYRKKFIQFFSLVSIDFNIKFYFNNDF